MHPSELCGRTAAGRGEAALPMSSRLLRPGEWAASGGTAAASPAAHPGARASRHDRGLRRAQEHHMKRRFTRAGRPLAQRTTIVNGILCLLLILVVLQLWLFTATMNAFLGGDESVIVPAALCSLVCFGLNLGLLRYVYQMES